MSSRSLVNTLLPQEVEKVFMPIPADYQLRFSTGIPFYHVGSGLCATGASRIIHNPFSRSFAC